MTTSTITTPVGKIPSPSNWRANADLYQLVSSDSNITLIEKQSGRTTVEDIGKALDEYSRLFKAGIASPAEITTLSRAYPNSPAYTKAMQKLGDEPVVVGGPASVELIDREGHMITTDALGKAFKNYMANFRTRNTMVLHSDVQVGWALPAYISKGGQIFKSGVDDKGLFFITELRKDTKIAEKVLEQIKDGKLKSYSIAGSATKTQNMQKGLMPYMQVDAMELAEVTICEKGVNQGASFEILKADGAATKSCLDGSCLIEKSDECNCGCDKKSLELLIKQDGNIDFIGSFKNWMQKEEDPLASGKAFSTLNNFGGREANHHSLLVRQGWPSEQPQEAMRYTPVVETEIDDDGIPIHPKPPWIVNEAGQDLGLRLDEDAPTHPKNKKKLNKAWTGFAGGGWASAPEQGAKRRKKEKGAAPSFRKEFLTNWENENKDDKISIYSLPLLKEHEDDKPHWCEEHGKMEVGDNHEGVQKSLLKSFLDTHTKSQEKGKWKDERVPTDSVYEAKASSSTEGTSGTGGLAVVAGVDAEGTPHMGWFDMVKKQLSKGNDIGNVFAVATAQAQKMGYTDFTIGSTGDNKRKEIAETLKRKGGMSE